MEESQGLQFQTSGLHASTPPSPEPPSPTPSSLPSVSYIELHTSSAFSFLDGASLPGTLIERAAELGYPAVALLDRDGVYGAPQFYRAAKKAGIKAPEDSRLEGDREALLEELRAERAAAAEARAAEDADGETAA